MISFTEILKYMCIVSGCPDPPLSGSFPNALSSAGLSTQQITLKQNYIDSLGLFRFSTATHWFGWTTWVQC